MPVIHCGLRGIGAWGPGVDNWPSLRAMLTAAGAESTAALADTVTPRPERIPPRERRRSPLAVKLAVEVASQACDEAGLDPADAACVFGSGMGDTQITDYMCRALDTEHRLLSPTRFHNSVHNAPVGYWSISTGCRRPANSVCAFEHTFPIALLEAAAQCSVEGVPVLLVLQDIRVPEPFEDILAVCDSFAVGLALEPAGDSMRLRVEDSAEPMTWPAFETSALRRLYETNPAARALALLQCLANGGGQISLPLGQTRVLAVDLKV